MLTLGLDALPGLGHACGHNLIATASVGGALATAEIMRAESLPGKVILFGTPAEESKMHFEKSKSGYEAEHSQVSAARLSFTKPVPSLITISTFPSLLTRPTAAIPLT